MLARTKCNREIKEAPDPEKGSDQQMISKNTNEKKQCWSKSGRNVYYFVQYAVPFEL